MKIENLRMEHFSTPRYSDDPQNANDEPLCEHSWGDDEPSLDMCSQCNARCDNRFEEE